MALYSPSGSGDSIIDISFLRDSLSMDVDEDSQDLDAELRQIRTLSFDGMSSISESVSAEPQNAEPLSSSSSASSSKPATPFTLGAFSNMPMPSPSTSIPALEPVSKAFSARSRKRKSAHFDDAQPPPFKRRRTSLQSIDEHSSSDSPSNASANMASLNQMQPMSPVAAADHDADLSNGSCHKSKNSVRIRRKIIRAHREPVRRSARLQNRRRRRSDTSLNPSMGSMGSTTSSDALSRPLSALNLEEQRKSIPLKSPKSSKPSKAQLAKSIEQSQSSSTRSTSKEWTDILSESVRSKWNRNATPVRSAMKAKRPTKSNATRSASVCWGKVECRAFEQRSGVLSDGVPQSKGPSLCLGRMLSETQTDLEEFESARAGIRKGALTLSRKERIARVKSFSPKDVSRGALSKDQRATNVLTASREHKGCGCTSIYKMKKDEMAKRLIFLGDGSCDEKALRKLKKKELMTRLSRVQFAKYGRYDVCCVDEDCECVRNGIECQIDSECCHCGGDTVYNNWLSDADKSEMDVSVPRKTDSLACANPNGNTQRLSAMDYPGDVKKAQHAVLATAQDCFVAFQSKSAQKCISDWNRHYDAGSSASESADDKENSVRCALAF